MNKVDYTKTEGEDDQTGTVKLIEKKLYQLIKDRDIEHDEWNRDPDLASIPRCDGFVDEALDEILQLTLTLQKKLEEVETTLDDLSEKKKDYDTAMKNKNPYTYYSNASAVMDSSEMDSIIVKLQSLVSGITNNKRP